MAFLLSIHEYVKRSLAFDACSQRIALLKSRGALFGSAALASLSHGLRRVRQDSAFRNIQRGPIMQFKK
jgi:hypothetical protein